MTWAYPFNLDSIRQKPNLRQWPFVVSTSTLIGLSWTQRSGCGPEEFRLSLYFLNGFGVGSTFLWVTKCSVARTPRPLARAAHSISRVQPFSPPLNLFPLSFVFLFRESFCVLAGLGSVRAREWLRRNWNWCWENNGGMEVTFYLLLIGPPDPPQGLGLGHLDVSFRHFIFINEHLWKNHFDPCFLIQSIFTNHAFKL